MNYHQRLTHIEIAKKSENHNQSHKKTLTFLFVVECNWPRRTFRKRIISESARGQKVPALKAAIEDLKAGRFQAGWEKLEHCPTLRAVRKKAFLRSAGRLPAPPCVSR